ncbi:MAG: hypothetical protein IPP84_05305 [Propionivibrio sp.]|uniref:hypothetical protein n=1 Tax=Propionivibrio sp. TaxID=2212460 RepID=UPI0025DB8B83|nr:hypothetical protein [Propionivibrio sp.]MBL0207396.1 hypothetical protein [Propionivibrio sp.]
MAAEALYGYDANKDPLQTPGQTYSGIINPTILTTGNRHASKFTPTEAEKFVGQWEVVEHLSDTSTGFSGTLFKALKDDPAQGIVKDQLVLSFRSTEFIDDSARDNQATNKMELAEGGWAMGQIADMEDWYASLKTSGKIPAGSSLSVTGYSLGGHLATAFNLLHPGEAASTYTFNGAGVGTVNAGESLRAVVDRFNLQRKNADGNQIVFSDPAAQSIYNVLRAKFSDGSLPNAADISNLDYQIYAGTISMTDGDLLSKALTRIKTIGEEIARLTTLTSGISVPGEPTYPARIPAENIAATRLDYQLAVLVAQKSTQAKDILVSAALGLRNTVNPPLANFYDVYGATYPSVTATSQLHYGIATPIFIEDQPLYRGKELTEAAKASLYAAFDAKGLVDDYTHNDFGDTHSLVLLIDSLNIQNTLATLDPTVTSGALDALLKAASAAKRDSVINTQGQCEGDVLENVLNGLCQIVMGSKAPEKLVGSLVGNTWADPASFVEKLYANLEALTDVSPTSDSTFKDLIGKITVSPARRQSKS